MAISKIYEALEDNRKEILDNVNHALDVLKDYNTGNLGLFNSKHEMIQEVEHCLGEILEVVSR